MVFIDPTEMIRVPYSTPPKKKKSKTWRDAFG